jgi:hypothetical protein
MLINSAILVCMAVITLNSFEMLSFTGSFDPHRNLRNIRWVPVGNEKVKVWGELRDDSTIREDQPRERVQTLTFDVVVPENSSVEEILTAIQQSLPIH